MANENKTTRQNLLKFLDVTEDALKESLEEIKKFPKVAVLDDTTDTAKRLTPKLEVLYHHAIRRLSEVRKTIARRFRFWRMKTLKNLGLYGEVLEAKLQFLWDSVRDKILAPILKLINIILDSLSMAFPPLDAVKEAKEVMEYLIVKLGPEGDPVTIKLARWQTDARQGG